jgi:hypothetical protein
MKKSIVQWCKDQAAQGNELKIVWEGGGDSGWVHFEIDGETIENEYTEALINKMYDTLNYGSWAGEFNANGEAIYDPETNAFEGTDYYGEDSSDVIEVDYTIRVPKKFWFETLNVEVECNYDDNSDVSALFIIKNGFLTDEHTDFCRNLEDTLREDFDFSFRNYSSNQGYEFRGCTDMFRLQRADAIEGEDELIFKITQVEIQVMTNEDRNIVLELDEEFAEAIDEQLNDE